MLKDNKHVNIPFGFKNNTTTTITITNSILPEGGMFCGKNKFLLDLFSDLNGPAVKCPL